jgi:hypothetical protein
MTNNNYDYASSYSIVYSIVYQFGTQGLEVDQIREFASLLPDETFEMIADKWVSVLFDEDYNMKETSQLVMNQKTKRLVALIHLENSSEGITSEGKEEDIVNEFLEQLEDISPEDFINGD